MHTSKISKKVGSAKYIITKIYISLFWKKKFLKTFITNIVFKITTFSQDKESIWLETLNFFGVSYEKRSRKKVLFHRRIYEIPCVMTSPRYFDFPRKLPNNIYYTNNFIESDIRKNIFDADSITKHVNSIISKNQNTKIVYCSLGTLASVHNKNSASFINRLLQIFNDLKEFHLIITLGKDIFKSSLDIPANISVFNYVNQLEVLKYVDMMITHGGMNTVSECIFAEVPMLVFPLNSKWDQNGNASRVKFHKIGLVGNLRNDNELKIHKYIKSLTGNPIYKTNIVNLKNRILNDRGKYNFFDFLIKNNTY